MVKIDLSFFLKMLPRDQTTVIDKAASMAGLVDATIQSVKRISTDLRPGLLDHLGISAAIEWQADAFSRRTGIPCRVASEPEEISLDKDLTTTVFRIFQETLTNVARHAKATKVTVLLRAQSDELMLEVKDNGRGSTKARCPIRSPWGLSG